MIEYPPHLRLPCLQDDVMGLSVIRGYARICDLAYISKPDVYDARSNPTGTQRDLSPKHAREAYDYVRNQSVGFFPEVFLAVRDRSIASFEVIDVESGFGVLHLKVDKIRASGEICISRVDGNHRLHFADGLSDNFPAIERYVSFCMALVITIDQEIKLFRDINNNQRRMNTSHLENIKLRLTEADRIASQDPMLFIASRLKDDSDSVLNGRVYDGGRSDIQKFIPLKTLKTGLEYMFSRPTRLTALNDVDIQIKLVKNYLSALKMWQPAAWEHPKDYLLLRGAGLWGAFFLGAEVIDRTLALGQYKPTEMLAVLKQGPSWDWSPRGPFKGFSGRAGASRIRDMIVAELEDGSGSSLKAIVERISRGI